MNCILGGFDSVASSFPHMTSTGAAAEKVEESPSVSDLSEASTLPAEEAEAAAEVTAATSIPWMPTMVFQNRVFLGRREQVEDIRVLRCLNITHVLSIGRQVLLT